MESNSRETSPDLGKKKSRRKPTVTRKITEDIDKVEPEADSSFDYLQAVEKNNKENNDADDEHLINGDSNDVPSKDGDDTSPSKNEHKKEDFIIPEGTVIVEPEAVEETKRDEYKGPEWKATKRLSRSAALGITQCTACNKQINTNNTGAAKRHPVLKVLICKRCYSWYASAEIEQDSDGMDEQCRWCGDGGNLICCDFCHNAFCKSCIKKNLGRKELSDIVDADDKAKWHCYVCDPKPLANLIADCTTVLETIDKELQKVDDKKKDKKEVVSVAAKNKPVQSQAHSRVMKQSQVAKKSTTPSKHSSVVTEKQGNQHGPNSAMTVTTPSGKVVLPPGAIPVKTVINKAGNQVIVLQQPTAANQASQNRPNTGKSSGVNTQANQSQLQIINDAVKNVSMAMGKGKPQIVVQKKQQEVKTVKSPVVRYEWDAPINEYNVGQALDRTLAVTESLRMVMVSLKDDMKKANSYPVQQCLEKKRIVAAKIRRAMGAFKKQVLDIEHFCKTTAKVMPQSLKPNQSKHDKTGQQKKKQPFPVSLLKNKRPGETNDAAKSKKDVEVIELSDSSEDEGNTKSSKKREAKRTEKGSKGAEREASPNKKNFQLKLRLGGSGDSLSSNKRKRKHSSDADGSEAGSEKENENHEEGSSPDDKKIPEKKQKKAKQDVDEEDNCSEDESLQSLQSRKMADQDANNKDDSEGEKEGKMTDQNTEDAKEESGTVNEEARNSHIDSESDSEVKEGNDGGNRGEDDVKMETETKAEAMDTEEHGDKSDNEKNDGEIGNDLVSKEQEEEAKDTEENKKEVANSESESDSEVKESREFQSDGEVNDEVEAINAAESPSQKEANHNSSVNAELENNEESSNQGVAEEMDADILELQDSKISSDGEKGVDFEQQVDGSKDKKKSERRKVGGDDKEDINGKGKGSVRKLALRSGPRSRNDIEAQRELHRELLEDSSEESESNGRDDEMEQDCLTLDSSSDESSSPDTNNDVDYTPNAESQGAKESHKNTAEKQSRSSKLNKKVVSSRKSRRFGEKPVEKMKAKQKNVEKTVADSDSDDSEVEKNSSKQKNKSKKSAQKSTHSSSRKKKVVDDSIDSDSEDEKPSSKRNGKKKGGKTAKQKRRKGESEANEDSSKENSENSTDYDSELENDIEKLARAPQFQPKKGKSKKKETPDSENEETDTKKKSTSKKEKSKPQKGRKERLEELSSEEDVILEEEEEDEMEEEEDDIQTAGERALAELERGLDIPSDYDDEEKARQDLLADDSPQSSDSDVDEILAEKQENKKSKKKQSSDSDFIANSEEQEESQMEQSQDDEITTKKTGSKKSKFGKNKLLDAVLSDSEEDFVIKSSKKKVVDNTSSVEELEEADSEDKEALTDVSSDFDVKPKKKVSKRKKKKSSSESEEDSDSSNSQTKEKGKKGKKGKQTKHKRIKVASDSDEQANSGGSDDGSDDEDNKGNKRKKIRKLIKDKKLSVDTKSAAKAEEERRKRIADRQKKYNQIDEEDVNSPTKTKITTKLVLEMDEKSKEPIIEVNSDLIRKLKPHQVEAVRFMWDCCIETLDRAKKEEGAGCILAHCMGLGKTLSVITFIHTLMRNEELTGIRTCLIVCPLNTVLNWQRELGHWLEEDEQLLVDELTSVKDNHSRCRLLEEWHKAGGCMIMGYEMYRNLSTLRNIKKAKQKKIITSALIEPGPDIVVCDEGHILKNDVSALSKAMSKIRTRRRIALTGTPLQNNLVEYHCMVDFVKPKLLGTRKEFMNRFVNPIKNGQCSDSSDHDVKLMKKRAHILHEKLAGCVQRRDYSALTKFLPPKHEYVISVRLSEVQILLYEKYLSRVGPVGSAQVEGEKIKGAKLFSDYQALMRIWTHPWVLKLQEIREEMKKMYDDTDEDSFIDDTDEDSFIDDSDNSSSSSEEASVQELSSDSDSGRRKRTRRGRNAKEQTNGKKGEVVKSWKTKSRGGGDTDSVKTTASTESEKKCENGEDPVSTEWWAEHISEEDKYSLEVSGKMMLLSEVLKMSENIGDKVLVFSQSLLSLDLIEDFLNYWDTDPSETQTAGTMGWTKGVDYFRMDGSTSALNRKAFATTFNDLDNVRARLFLISTKAGSLGTNLVGANRVIIFDASWNPSHDTQSIFRVYRFGQTKPVYIYRFLAQGTMEEKIYERQVTKQSLSQRVVDEHQVERHFTNADLSELYNFKPERFDENKDYLPVLPKDMLLADLLTLKKQWIVKYHEHDSLLENKIEEDLTEEERKAAWEEFELEKKHGFRPVVRPMGPATGQPYNYNNINTQYARGASNYYLPPPQFSVKEIEELAKAVYAANPGISQMELQMRVQNYVSRQQQLYQQRQREQMMHEMARLRQLQDERQKQELALQAAYNKSQIQGTSGGSSASSLLRTLMVAGQGNKDNENNTNDVIEITNKSQNSS